MKGGKILNEEVFEPSILSLINLEEFYNKCHDEEGKFCETPGGEGITGRSQLRDSDATVAKPKKEVKRGKLGASLIDPNEGTKEIDGVRGYDPKTGKPVPG